MGSRKREARFRMIEGANLAPALLAVAALAGVSKPSLMLVVLPVAVDAPARSRSELFFWLVAAFAGYLLVAARELKIREIVVEGLFVELHDVGRASLMIRMTAVAVRFGGVWPLAMQAAAEQAIAGDVLMAVKAKPGLRRFCKRFVAIPAVFFELCMTLNEFTRHNELLKNILRPCSPNSRRDEKKDRYETEKIAGCHSAPA
jgi:hypothetical protein